MQEHGHFSVSHWEKPVLYNFVKHQRLGYPKYLDRIQEGQNTGDEDNENMSYSIVVERIEALKEIGFVVDPRGAFVVLSL